jgi:germination protein M
MIKKSAAKRIIIASIALLILLITYLFPTTSESSNINQTLSYTEPNKSTIFLLDNSNMVARTKTITKSTDDTISKAKEIINALIINSSNSKYNPSGFKAIIPEGTKINSISLNDNILKINFNENILNISLENEEKMLEALIYSLTEIQDIKGIMIFVNNDLLTTLPNSNKQIPDILDRSYGINKVYEIDDVKNTTKTTVYYLSEYEDNKYYTPVTFITNDTEDKIEIIIERLKSSPINQTNLMSYLASSAELLDYEITESSVNLSFNNYIFDEFSDNNILEEVKYTIGLSIKDNYSVDEVVFNVNDEKIDNFELNSLE